MQARTDTLLRASLCKRASSYRCSSCAVWYSRLHPWLACTTVTAAAHSPIALLPAVGALLTAAHCVMYARACVYVAAGGRSPVPAQPCPRTCTGGDHSSPQPTIAVVLPGGSAPSHSATRQLGHCPWLGRAAAVLAVCSSALQQLFGPQAHPATRVCHMSRVQHHLALHGSCVSAGQCT